jgi:hypothetical protein
MERPVERIEFIPRGSPFVVAGITTSDVDENPFVREPARPVRLVPKDGLAGVLDVDVDRGVATYPQPLPGADDRAGWGAAEGTAAYTSIAALPSATVAVRRGDEELGRVRWGDVERDGRADAGQVSLELVEGGRNCLHGLIAATAGQSVTPTARARGGSNNRVAACRLPPVRHTAPRRARRHARTLLLLRPAPDTRPRQRAGVTRADHTELEAPLPVRG